jgi:hypothetical protein
MADRADDDRAERVDGPRGGKNHAPPGSVDQNHPVRLVRAVDEDVPDFDRRALEEGWEFANYLSIHNYATNWENDTPSFLAYSVEFERHIDTLATVLRETKQKLGAEKRHLPQPGRVERLVQEPRHGRQVARRRPPLCEENVRPAGCARRRAVDERVFEEMRCRADGVSRADRQRHRAAENAADGC